VVSGQHRTRMYPAVLSGLDIMLHVADEYGLGRPKPVFAQDFVNPFPLVPNVDVGFLKIFAETRHRNLDLEMVAMNGAQQEHSQVACSAELKELPRMRQRTH